MHLSLLYRRLRNAGLLLVLILLAGTFGYHFLSPQATLFDGLYMTVITVTTIGYGEVVDLQGNIPGRIFTMLIAFSGIGIITYVFSNVAALIIEADLGQVRKFKRMEKQISLLDGHYIICGLSNPALKIAEELYRTNRAFVVADQHPEPLAHLSQLLPGALHLQGDCTDEEFLRRLGIEKAEGAFITTTDDNVNLVICLTGRQINPGIRLIAMCKEPRNEPKLTRVGASKVILPASIGGMRMASEMVRPTVTTFLDVMMRDQHLHLRVEEIKLAPRLAGKPLSAITFDGLEHTILMAVRTGQEWKVNPPATHVIEEGNVLIILTSVQERQLLEERYAS